MMGNVIVVIIPEKKHSWSQGDFFQTEFGVFIVSKDEGRLFTVCLQDGMSSWGIPKGAVRLPNKTMLRVEVK